MTLNILKVEFSHNHHLLMTKSGSFDKTENKLIKTNNHLAWALFAM